MTRQLSTNNLTHPSMIAKIRAGLYHASKGQGEKMNGHGKRVYIQNKHGHNIMRLDWVGGRVGYIVYGNESVNITRKVRSALAFAAGREMANPNLVQDSYKVAHTEMYANGKHVGYKERANPKTFGNNRSSLQSKLATVAKVAGITAFGMLMSGCSWII